MISGYSKNELLNKNIAFFVGKNKTDDIRRNFDDKNNLEAKGKIFEWALSKKDGSTCYVETSLYTKTDDSGKIIGSRGLVRDITQRHQTQKALALSEELFSKCFHFSPVGMALSKMDSGELLKVNSTFLEYSGLSTDKTIGNDLVSLKFYKKKKDRERLLGILKKDQRLTNQEIEYRKASGEIRKGRLSAEIIEIQGDLCILSAFEDVTEARQLEMNFLTMVEKERQKMAFDLHDDLCPQLIGIKVIAGIFKRRLSAKPDKLVEEFEKIVSLIQESINKTRLFARGLCSTNIASQGFESALAELSQYVKDIYNVSCHIEVDQINNFINTTMATHIYYIIHEALHNAIKHADAKNIFIKFIGIGEKSLLEIKDDGCGIKSSLKDRGMGMKIMQYRSKIIDASFTVEKRSCGGTKVLLEIDN